MFQKNVRGNTKSRSIKKRRGKKNYYIQPNKKLNQPLILLINIFCGAGGNTIAFEKAKIKGQKVAKVIACVNDDAKAIESHWLNYPEVKHFEEYIRTLYLKELIKIVAAAKVKYSNAKIVLWASLECTNFSKVKGGKSRD